MIVVADTSAVDVLCPMYLLLDANGVILQAGPTLIKMLGAERLKGADFFDLFEVRRPRALVSMAGLRGLARRKLHLKLTIPPHTQLKGVVVPLGGGLGRQIINLSFGFSVIEAVRDFGLSGADFAATDLAIEMLYLVEANRAAMEASHRLTMRLEGARVAAEEQALSDPLTGLSNRRALEAALDRLIDSGMPFTVMQVDLDFFKTVNDTLGHAAGDFVLQTVARTMMAETRAQDTVARIGGDEFTILLPGVTDEETLMAIGTRLIESISRPIHFQGRQCSVSASVGAASIRQGQTATRAAVLAQADAALYASKDAGRSRQTLFQADRHRDKAGE